MALIPDEIRVDWDTNEAFWEDAYIGNAFHDTYIVGRAVMEVLRIESDERCLEPFGTVDLVNGGLKIMAIDAEIKDLEEHIEELETERERLRTAGLALVQEMTDREEQKATS